MGIHHEEAEGVLEAEAAAAVDSVVGTTQDLPKASWRLGCSRMSAKEKQCVR